ncbi:hypothetical protein [Galactobacter valiniphilus]|uniref:hypothetical protein n=1 Tax=Galactobacter valiniphilus TaxID=2676122 RepID=UPI00373545E4
MKNHTWVSSATMEAGPWEHIGANLTVLLIVVAVLLPIAVVVMVIMTDPLRGYGRGREVAYWLRTWGLKALHVLRTVRRLIAAPGENRRRLARARALHADALRYYLSFELEKAYERPELIDPDNARVRQYLKAMRQTEVARLAAEKNSKRSQQYENAAWQLQRALEAAENATRTPERQWS